MNKEVIIDGVDVSKCEFYCFTANFHKCDCLGGKARENSTVGNLNCEDNQNCYFKQLKRKEQECEKLKQWKEDAKNLFKTQIDNADKIVNRYKQVLDKIKDICNTYQREYMVNNGVQLLTTKILQAIED